jgi:hypothetical protein
LKHPVVISNEAEFEKLLATALERAGQKLREEMRDRDLQGAGEVNE